VEEIVWLEVKHGNMFYGFWWSNFRCFGIFMMAIRPFGLGRAEAPLGRAEASHECFGGDIQVGRNVVEKDFGLQ
jgi:hypothetical protein